MGVVSEREHLAQARLKLGKRVPDKGKHEEPPSVGGPQTCCCQSRAATVSRGAAGSRRRQPTASKSLGATNAVDNPALAPQSVVADGAAYGRTARLDVVQIHKACLLDEEDVDAVHPVEAVHPRCRRRWRRKHCAWVFLLRVIHAPTTKRAVLEGGRSRDAAQQTAGTRNAAASANPPKREGGGRAPAARCVSFLFVVKFFSS